MIFFLFLTFFFQVLCPDSLENGWKGIRSLKTDKVSAEKILGKPEIYRSGIHNYETSDARVQIDYSAEPCKKTLGNRGDFNVPKDTILEYLVFPKNSIKLDEIKFDRTKYMKLVFRQEYFDFEYINDAEGVGIMTKIKDGVEYVYRLRFEPRIKNIGNRKCETTENK